MQNISKAIDIGLKEWRFNSDSKEKVTVNEVPLILQKIKKLTKTNALSLISTDRSIVAIK